MAGIMECNQTNRCKILSASVFCFVVVIYGVFVSVWISTLSRNVERNQELHNKKRSLACHICFTYSRSTALEFNCKEIESICEIEGWRKRKSLPASCKNDPKVKEFVKKEVRRVFDKTKNEFESKRLEPDELKYLQTAEESFYAPSRTIIHWSPTAKTSMTAASADTEGWQTVEEFCHDRTTYTISPGNTNSYSNGTVNITKTGLYLIYARLTFACTNPDRQKKRIHMEVVVQSKPKSQKARHTILKDLQTATCSIEGDLLTMYQSGIFRLAEDNKIKLRYKIPANVTLSNGDEKLYKSSIGLIRLGLA